MKRKYIFYYSQPLIFIAILILPLVTKAQKKKPFRGEIKYEVIYEGNIPEGSESYIPRETIHYIDGANSRLEVISESSSQITITNAEEEYVAILFDMMGKIALKMTKEELLAIEEDTPAPKPKKLDEKKTIAGYECHKVEVNADDGKGNMIVGYFFVTEEINIQPLDWTKEDEIKGAKLEFSQSIGDDFTIIFRAKEVNKKKIDPDLFNIPEEYEVLTQEELDARMGGE